MSKPAYMHWRVLRTGLTGLADADWAEDISDDIPTTGTSSATFHKTDAVGKSTEVEFFVMAYVAATGRLVDLAGENFSCEVYYFIPLRRAEAGSSITGREAADEKIAVRQSTLTLLQFNQLYRFECAGQDEWTLRLHTLSGAPVGADRYEVMFREVTQ